MFILWLVCTIDILYNKYLDTALPFISMAKSEAAYSQLGTEMSSAQDNSVLVKSAPNKSVIAWSI